MIVLEVNFVSNENDFVSMSTNVLGKTKDKKADTESFEFETSIIPIAMKQINEKFNNISLVDNENLCVDMMNVLVEKAKQYHYTLKRLGQNEKYPDTYQLEFRKETDGRFMGTYKEIREQV